MPAQVKEDKPRPKHGIVETPWKIPADRLPNRQPQKSEQPLFVTLICGYLLIRGGVCMLLAMVPWSDPDSAIASFLIARSALVFGLIPRFILPYDATVGRSAGTYAQGLPLLFVVIGIIYLLCAWKLWNLDRFWVPLIRWGIMFQSGAAIAKTLIGLSARYVGESEAPLSQTAQLAIAVSIVWNLVIFCCFALFPRVEEV